MNLSDANQSVILPAANAGEDSILFSDQENIVEHRLGEHNDLELTESENLSDVGDFEVLAPDRYNHTSFHVGQL